MNKNYYAILMAGGVGSRFWPVSTQDFPKQFHDMLGTGDTLIQKTFHRLTHLIPKENIYILTNERYNDLVLEQLPQVTQKQVVLEPAMRNTAPCILYASLKIQKENPDAVMIVAPSDHWIEDEAIFSENVKQAFDFCSKNNALMTLGIQPTFPNTGYGYIEFDKTSAEAIKETYPKAENISVDYAIMEKSSNVFVIAAEFDWNDLGTWGSLYDKLEKNEDGNAVVNSRTLAEDASGNMIRTKNDKIVVIDGLNDYIIVDKDEVLLIFPKTKEQDIKKVLQKVKDKFGEQYG